MPADKSLKDLSNAVYKIAENSPKIQKDVKDIRDAVCGTDGILESLYVITKNMEGSQKKDTLSRISTNRSTDANSKKLLKSTNSITSLLKKILGSVDSISSKSGRNRRLHAENFRRDDDRRVRNVKGLESLSKSVEIIERLRNIKLKDFIFAKRKMKNISKIIFSALNMFRHFKNQKEVDGTLGLVNSSMEIMNKLKKVWLISKPAQWGEKAIEKILLGGKKNPKGGLLGIFRKLSKNERHIKKGKRSINDILKSCGSFLLTTMILTGVAALSIPAMVGTLLMKGVIYLLIGTYKVLNKSSKVIIKGSVVLLAMSTSVITFALGLGLMVRSIKGMNLKDIGLMVASIAGVGLSVAGIGLLAIPIAIGSASLLLMGASIGILGLALKSWKEMDSKSAMANIKTTINDLKDAFGLNSKESVDGKGLGSQLKSVASDALGFASAIFQFGKTFFQVGSILLCIGVMAFTRKRLDEWKDYNPGNAISNIKNTLGGIKEALGLDTHEPENLDDNGLLNQLKGVGSDIMGFVSTIFQFGKMFFNVGTILLGIGIMGFVRERLDKWKDYDPGNSISNMKNTLGSIKDALGLDTHEPENLDGKGLLQQAGGVVSDVLSFGAAILQFGKSFFQMGSIFLGMGMMNKVRDNLEKWNDYNSAPAIGNIKKTISNLREAMGLINNNEENEENTTEQKAKWYERVWEGIKDTGKKISTVASGVANGIKSMARLSSLVDFTSAMADIKDYLSPYDNYDSSKSIGNIKNTVTNLLSVIRDSNNDIERSKAFKKISENIKDGVNDFKKLNKIDISNTSIDKTVKSINMLDLERAAVMTDMFKSFAKIGDKPFNKFTDAVNKFVKSCGELITSMDKLSSSNESESEIIKTTTDNSTTSPKNNRGFYIENTKDLAQAIADAIRSLPINVENDISDVRLVVDGTSGKKVILSLE